MSVPIVLEQVSATVSFGGGSFSTPSRGGTETNYLVSFSISSSRGGISTLKATAIAEGVYFDNGSSEVRVTSNPGGTIFVGNIKSVSQEPHWSDSRCSIINITAEDCLAKLRNKKVTRRVKLHDLAYAVINGGQQHSAEVNATVLSTGYFNSNTSVNNSSSVGPAGNSPLVRTPDHGAPSASPSRSGFSARSSSVRFTKSSAFMAAGDRLRVGIDVDGVALTEDMIQKGLRSGICVFLARDAKGEKKKIEVGPPGTTPDAPLSVELNPCGIEITALNDYPTVLYFAGPNMGQGHMMIDLVPLHDHRTMSRGGPAVGSYDVFQV